MYVLCASLFSVDDVGYKVSFLFGFWRGCCMILATWYYDGPRGDVVTTNNNRVALSLLHELYHTYVVSESLV